jgi:GNAT superfamily N-acetyltransferase
MQKPAIIQPGPQHALALINLAHTTWQATYPGIISQEQIDFMLARFYNRPLVESQLADPTQFFRAIEEKQTFLGYLHAYPENNALKVSKLYVLPTAHKQGLGKILLHNAELEAQRLGLSGIRLNVNRYNPAYQFYLHLDFLVEETIDIPLDKYILNDYIMFKPLPTT